MSDLNHSAYEWVDSSSADRSVPPMAIQMGVDSQSYPIFAGRAHFSGELAPVQVVPDKRGAFVAYGGQEHRVENYQVLCAKTFKWVKSSRGRIPPGAVQTGHNKDGAPLFVGRVYHGGTHIIGKVHPKFEVCYFPYQGKEITVSNYEVLCFGFE